MQPFHAAYVAEGAAPDVGESGIVPSRAAEPTARRRGGPRQHGGARIAVGTVLGGKYLVRRLVGRGSFALVYEAVNLELDEPVALKCMRPELLGDADRVAQFAREAKTAARIKSAYVVRVHDLGTCVDGPFAVMEYLEGKHLGQILDKGPLAVPVAVEYALQICEALAVAHAKGIVHRDVKPENLLVTTISGMSVVKVIDFGTTIGTPLYMSPEQLRASTPADARSDVWSIGMVLYEMLTGKPAFSAASVPEVCAAILESNPLPLPEPLPAGLRAVVGRCLEKDVARRYQSVAELAVALLPFGPERACLNVERAVSTLQDALISVPSPAVPAPASRRPTKGLWLAGLGLVVLVTSGAFVFRGQPHLRPAARTATSDVTVLANPSAASKRVALLPATPAELPDARPAPHRVVVRESSANLAEPQADVVEAASAPVVKPDAKPKPPAVGRMFRRDL